MQQSPQQKEMHGFARTVLAKAHPQNRSSGFAFIPCVDSIKTDLIKSLNLQCRRFEFCPEVTAKIAKMKIKIYEVPVSYNPRNKAEGKKLRFKDGIEAIWTLLKYKFVK